MNTYNRVVDLSGYSFSGKSAIYDFLTGYSYVKGHGIETEFDLIRSKNGILNLYDNVVENWSLVRSSVAIRDFKRLVYFLGGEGTILDRMLRGGTHYGLNFPLFDKIMEDYVTDLITDSWNSYWPFFDFGESKIMNFKNKITQKIFRKSELVFLAKCAPNDFIKITQKALNKLVLGSLNGSNRVLLLNNCCEPINPDVTLKFFLNACSIIVDRDPRDIYLSALGHKDRQVGLAATGGSVETFVVRFKALRETRSFDSQNILRINFEQLVNDFETAKSAIERHVGRSYLGRRSNQAQKFCPHQSANNVSQWKNNTLYKKHKKELSVIERELNEYLFNES